MNQLAEVERHTRHKAKQVPHLQDIGTNLGLQETGFAKGIILQ